MALSSSPRRRTWTLITNHGAALLFLNSSPSARIGELAEALAITERSAARTLADLRSAGYVRARRVGRRNVYELAPELPLRHVLVRDWPLDTLLRAFSELRPREHGASITGPPDQALPPDAATDSADARPSPHPRES